MENKQHLQELRLKKGKPWFCCDCSKLIAIRVVIDTEYGKSTVLRIKNKDHVVLIEDPTSQTTVSIICQRCAAFNQHAPVGDPRQLDLLKKQEDNTNAF